MCLFLFKHVTGRMIKKPNGFSIADDPHQIEMGCLGKAIRLHKTVGLPRPIASKDSQRHSEYPTRILYAQPGV